MGGSVEMLPPSWAIPPNGGILVVDDLPDADASVQRALYGLVLDRRLGSHQLDDSISVICTGNPPDRSSRGTDLPEALAGRLVHAQCTEADALSASLGMWPPCPPARNPPGAADIARAAALLAGFRRSARTEWPADELGASPSARTWHACATLIADGLDPFASATATVGRAAALELSAWLHDSDLPSPEALIAGAAIPDRPDAAFACLAALIAAQLPTGATWNTVAACADRAVLAALLPALRTLGAPPASAARALEAIAL